MTLMVVTTIVLLLASIYTIRKIKSVKISELYTTSLFAILMAFLADMYLDVKLDLYGFFQKGIDWSYLPILLIDYSAANILFLRFFPYKKTIIKKMIYILGWSLGSLAFEQIALHTDLFYYNGWKWWSSAIAYPFLYFVLYGNLLITRKLDSL